MAHRLRFRRSFHDLFYGERTSVRIFSRLVLLTFIAGLIATVAPSVAEVLTQEDPAPVSTYVEPTPEPAVDTSTAASPTPEPSATEYSGVGSGLCAVAVSVAEGSGVGLEAVLVSTAGPGVGSTYVETGAGSS